MSPRCETCNYLLEFCTCTQVAEALAEDYDNTPNWGQVVADHVEEGAERNSAPTPDGAVEFATADVTELDIERLVVAWFDYSENGCPNCAAYLDDFLEEFVGKLIEHLGG